MLDVPESAAVGAGCRLSVTLASAPEQLQLDNDVGFYQLPGGDVTLTPEQLLTRQHALFAETGGELGEVVSEADCGGGVWAVMGP